MHPCPEKDHRNFSVWNRCNNMVVSWLVHSVSLPIRKSIIWMDSALDIWNDLKTRYSQGDLSRISDLQVEVASLNQGDLSVTEYFTKLRIIWDVLDNFRPIPMCTCSVKCFCLVNSIISQRKCEDYAMQFLRGLNDQYSNGRSHVLLMELIPPISKIFSLVAQQERQLANHIYVSISSINSVDSTRTSSSTLCTFFVVSMGTLKMFVLKELGSLIKTIGTPNLTLERYARTVTEMVTLWIPVTRNMATLLGTNTITAIGLVRLTVLLLLMVFSLSLVLKNRKNVITISLHIKFKLSMMF